MIRIRLPELIAKKAFHEGRRVELTEVAAATGIHRSTLSKLIHARGHNLTASNLDRLCRYFQCDVQDVLTYVPDEELLGEVSPTFKGPAPKSKTARTVGAKTRSGRAKSGKA